MPARRIFSGRRVSFDIRRATVLMSTMLLVAFSYASPRGYAADQIAGSVEPQPPPSETSKLDAALDSISPELKKWATICLVENGPDNQPKFTWTDYRDTGWKTDFWPASTIKLYAAVAALELLSENGFPLDANVQFEHRAPDGAWVLDCARSMREMLSEVFRRSSNEDYTLLLRMVGIDRINTQFLIPERGFPHSALMRGYVLERPYRYVLSEPQRITLRSANGEKSATLTHTWSGRFYAQERGCTVIDEKTGNMTSPRELAECLRRVLFHESLPEPERYHLSAEQLEFLRHGAGGLIGLETKLSSSGPRAWTNAAETVFPTARFFHKCGVISNYALEVAALDDSVQSGARFILVPVINAGEDSKPVIGQELVGKMSREISLWVRSKIKPDGN
ncbi:serine hydrolase [Verrucomicrobiota bacterium sgz303538]